MKNRGLEIATDLKHQRRMWIMERVGWGIMAVIVIAALTGLLGSGPLSKARAGQQGSALQMDYERFARYEAPTDLKLRVGAGHIRDRVLRIWISRDYLDDVGVERTMPTADANEMEANRVIYMFHVAETNRPVEVAFHLRPNGYGKSRGRIGVVGGPELQFAQFVYP